MRITQVSASLCLAATLSSLVGCERAQEPASEVQHKPTSEPMVASESEASPAISVQSTAGTSNAVEIVVTSGSKSTAFGSLSDAIRACEPSSSVVLSAGVYSVEDLVIDKPISLKGPSTGEAAVVTSTQSNTLTIRSAGVTISNLQIRCVNPNPSLRFSGLFVDAGAAEIANCQVSSSSGCSVYISKSSDQSKFSKCIAENAADAGFFFVNGGRGVLLQCEARNNSNAGLGIAVNSEVTVVGGAYADGGDAGVLLRAHSVGKFTNVAFTSNRLSGANVGDNGSASFKNCTFAKNGDIGLLCSAGFVEADNCTFESNTHPNIQIQNGGRGMIRGCQIIEGLQDGIAIDRNSSAEIIDSDASGNGLAGVLVGAEAVCTIKACRVHRNAQNGVEVMASGEATITSCDISGNEGEDVKVKDGGRVTVN